MIDVLSGAPADAPRFVMARLGGPLGIKPGLTRFLPARLVNRAGFGAEVTVVLWHGSGDLAGTSKANCYVVVPSDRGRLEVGEMVSVLLD